MNSPLPPLKMHVDQRTILLQLWYLTSIVTLENCVTVDVLCDLRRGNYVKLHGRNRIVHVLL